MSGLQKLRYTFRVFFAPIASSRWKQEQEFQKCDQGKLSALGWVMNVNSVEQDTEKEGRNEKHCLLLYFAESQFLISLTVGDELGILEFWTSLRKADVCAIPTEVCKMPRAPQSMHAEHIFEYQP